jgi:hypothetical protein
VSRDDEAAERTGGSPETTPPGAAPTGGIAALEEPRTLRPGSAVAVGASGGVVGLVLLYLGLTSSPRSWTLVSTVVLALVLVWLFVVRPCAVVHAAGVRLVNPLRVVDLTWPAIDEIRSKWALELLHEGRKYTAWGIPADPGRPKYGRSMLTLGASKVLGRDAQPEAPRRPKIEAQTVAAEIEALVAEDRQAGSTPRVASQAWDPVSVGLLLAGVAFFVIGAFVV